jgi:hypothetical protein
MEPTTIDVTATWDPEARVWIAESDQLPGLILEAEQQEQLVEKVFEAVPDLLAGTDVARSARSGVLVRVISQVSRLVHVAA